ncbi:MAG: UvrD-helicase domain-containing protein [Deltaproteobacteria bacterium]|nr:UvrD-helicase domain-containing protein [Deltaproteobacteria bacterium]
MRFFADIHIHSHFSRATSRDLTIPTLLVWAQKKGLGLLGTGDCTHPGWMAEIEESLEEDGKGFLIPKDPVALAAASAVPEALQSDVRFILQVEVSSIFKKGDRVRKVHTLVYVPDLASARRFGESLGRLGNVKSDGRPILGLEPLKILRLAKDAHADAMVIPAHVWTPHFSLFGARSGFDAIEECFEGLSDEIFALETGLSSDALMNRRWSALDRFALVSSSDAHSPAKLGREATILDCDRSYDALVSALKGQGGLSGTVEFFPEEGKYHLDGHRKCGVRSTPAETRRLEGLCPECGKKMTPGVLGRVDGLADRPELQDLDGFASQHSLIPLTEVLGELLAVGPASRRVGQAYERTLAEFGPELELLGWSPLDSLASGETGLLAEALDRMRKGRVRLDGGYDGEYGRVGLFAPGEVDSLRGQGLLFDGGEAAKPVRKRKVKKSASDVPAGVTAADSPVVKRVAGHGGLNHDQKAAVDAEGGAVLVVAGPGTGKTRTLVARAARLLNAGVDPRRMLILTFTNRAADEARERLSLDVGDRGSPLVTTFHSFALTALTDLFEARGYPAPEVIETSEALHILRGLMETGGVEEPDAMARSLLEGRGRGEQPAEGDRRWRDGLENRMRQRGVVDLDGLIPALLHELDEDPELGVRLPGHYLHVLVDEFQDIGSDQYGLVRRLKPDGVGLFAVGDPDQSIYAFRGSDPRAFERFREDWKDTRLVHLGKSYRCPPEVLSAAKRSLGRGGSRRRQMEGSAGSMVSQQPGGVPVRLYAARSPMDEAAWICREIQSLVGGLDMFDSTRDGGRSGFDDVVVLARNHWLLDPVADVLTSAGLPVERASDRPLWDTPWVKVVMEALREEGSEGEPSMIAKGALDTADLRAPGRDLKALLGLVADLTPDQAAARLATLKEVDAFGLGPERVKLLTIHAAKGLEFDCVFLAGCEDGVLPMDGGKADLEEERRLLFVALTRARKQLNVSFPVARGRGRGRLTRFITEATARPFERVVRRRIRKPAKPVQQSLFGET